MAKQYSFFTQDDSEADRLETVNYGHRYVKGDPRRSIKSLGYKQRIAETTGGWLPLFFGDRIIRSIEDIKKIYDESEGRIIIIDEEGTELSWEDFDRDVIQFNGGTSERRKLVPISDEEIEREKAYNLFDPKIRYLPISHFESSAMDDPLMAERYFTDRHCYEFFDMSRQW